MAASISISGGTDLGADRTIGAGAVSRSVSRVASSSRILASDTRPRMNVGTAPSSAHIGDIMYRAAKT